MGIWPLGKPRFRDVQSRELAMPSSGKVSFFAPHTSEHGATMPLISKLSEKLSAMGVETSTYSIDDMRDRLGQISAKLSQMRFSKHEKVMLDALFRMNDAIVRLGLLAHILEDERDSSVVEMHALDRDYQDDDRFEHKDFYYRIPRTRILYVRDFLREYRVPLEQGLSAFDDLSGPIIEAATLLDLDPARIKQQSKADLMLLGANIGRLALLEVPAPVREPEDVGTLTRFEQSYGMNISLSHTLKDDEIDRLAKALAGVTS